MNNQEMLTESTESHFTELIKIIKIIGILEKILKTNPTDWQLKMDLANLYSRKGQHDDAVRLYKEILDENENNVEVLINVGIVYQLVGDDQKALEIYQRAIRLAREKSVAPEYLSLAYSNLGVIFESRDDFDRAVIAYKKALSICPDNLIASEYLAKLQEYGDIDLGILQAKILPDGKKEFQLWYYRDVNIDYIDVDKVLGI